VTSTSSGRSSSSNRDGEGDGDAIGGKIRKKSAPAPFGPNNQQPGKILPFPNPRMFRPAKFVFVAFFGMRVLEQTRLSLADMAPSVIADLTDAKSVLQELRNIVPNRPPLPIQAILLAELVGSLEAHVVFACYLPR
jgi:hypothetical protein